MTGLRWESYYTLFSFTITLPFLSYLPAMLHAYFQKPQDAVLSALDGCYRYLITRTWQPSGSTVAFIMLNPSKADAEVNDPTVRRCMLFAQDWKHNSLAIVNLYAWRETHPSHLCAVEQKQAVGPDADHYLQAVFSHCTTVVAAWGTNAYVQPERVQHVLGLAHQAGVALQCLGTNQNGSPRHPLFVPATKLLEAWPA